MCSRLRNLESYEEVLCWKRKLTPFLPSSLSMLNILDMCNKHKLLDDIHAPVKVYVPSGDHPPIFILTTPATSQKKLNTVTLFWDIKTLSSDDVKSLLLQLPGWDLTKHLYFYITYTPLKEKLLSILECSDGDCIDEATITTVADTSLYSTQQITAKLPQLGDDFEVKLFSKKDMDVAFTNWEYNWTEDLPTMRELVNKFLVVGVFDKKQQTPISWTVEYKDGTFGMTFTLPEYRKRGFATLVYHHTLQFLKERGEDRAYINVEDWNTISQRFHKNIGFKEEDVFSYFVYLPKGMNLKSVNSLCMQ